MHSESEVQLMGSNLVGRQAGRRTRTIRTKVRIIRTSR
jgi:hypothetical protein